MYLCGGCKKGALKYFLFLVCILHADNALWTHNDYNTWANGKAMLFVIKGESSADLCKFNKARWKKAAMIDF